MWGLDSLAAHVEWIFAGFWCSFAHCSVVFRKLGLVLAQYKHNARKDASGFGFILRHAHCCSLPVVHKVGARIGVVLLFGFIF